MSRSAEAVRLILTLGEPAGIGADILIQLAQIARTEPLLVCACPQLLKDRAREMNLALSIRICDDPNQDLPTEAGTLAVWPIATAQPVQSGKLCAQNARYVLTCLERAVKLCINDHRYGLVTGPVNKGHLVASGIDFYGHTEYLGELCGVEKPLMMLANQDMRVALLTTHIPLAEVAKAINASALKRAINILHHFLTHQLQIESPLIAICGLNPHAGDDGALGHEERDIIEPCLNALRARGLRLLGPLSADTAFIRPEVQKADAILAMYHDQGLPVLKYAGFGDIVNITLGLPIVRTSVDHGTALELAGSGKARCTSMLSAIRMATQLIKASA